MNKQNIIIVLLCAIFLMGAYQGNQKREVLVVTGHSCVENKANFITNKDACGFYVWLNGKNNHVATKHEAFALAYANGYHLIFAYSKEWLNSDGNNETFIFEK